MFFRFFDRTPISRDRDYFGLTETSEISGGPQRFGLRQRFDHFESWRASTSSWYSTGESPPIKAGHWGTIPHFESTCTRFNTSAGRRTRPSAGPERSQQLQILPSLNSKAVLQQVLLLFLLRQHFCRRQRFWMRQVFSIRQRFWMRQCFWIRRVFWMCQCFWIRRVLWTRQCFRIRQVFWMRQCFWICRVFWTHQCFCMYFAAPTFL